MERDAFSEERDSSPDRAGCECMQILYLVTIPVPGAPIVRRLSISKCGNVTQAPVVHTSSSDGGNNKNGCCSLVVGAIYRLSGTCLVSIAPGNDFQDN